MTYRGSAKPKSPARLYRDPEGGKILGVCAGIADYFGFNPWAVRAVAVVALFMFTAFTVIAYLIAGFVLDRKPRDLYETETEEVFWRQVRTQPNQTVRDIRHRFRDLEKRLRELEAHVTSQEFKLKREIDGLGD